MIADRLRAAAAPFVRARDALPSADKGLAALGGVARVLSPLVKGLSTALLPANAALDSLRILTLSAIVTMFFLYLGAFSVLHGWVDYWTWADALVSGASLAGHGALAWRDIGYALVLVAGGFPWTHSFIGVTIIAAAMAIAMPLLVYFTLRPWFPRAAYWTAFATIISLSPVLLVKVIHHDHPYIFFMLVATWSLGRYQAGSRPVHLYGFALSVFAMSLVRLIGQGMYPFLLVLAYVQSRKNLKHFIASALVFAACVAAYSSYRAHTLAAPPPILGQQVLYNMYLNLAEFGVSVSPELGPNTDRLFKELRDRFLPSPAQSSVVVNYGTSPEFLRDHFLSYSANELLKNFFAQPNREYYHFIVTQMDDRLLLLVCLEIALRHPDYVLGYTLRQMLQLLWDPGYVHARYDIRAHLQKEGFNFPLSGGIVGYGYNIDDTAPEPALTEAYALPLLRQPRLVNDMYFLPAIEWQQHFQGFVKVLFCFIMIAWLSTAIGLLARIVRTPLLARLSELMLSERVIAASSGISLLLLLNVGLTAVLVDPMYRYEFSMVILKIMLAGVGVAVLVHLLARLAVIVASCAGMTMPARAYGLAANPRAPAAGPGRRPPYMAIAAALLSVFIVAGFTGWAWSLRAMTLATPADGTVRVTSATVGAYCGAPHNNALQQVYSSCFGKKQCGYLFDWRTLRSACGGNLDVEWTCSDGGPPVARSWPPMRHKTVVQLSCP